MDPEISKLLAAIVELVTTLKDKAGLPDNIVSESGDERFDDKKQKVVDREDVSNLSGPETRKWENISKIFAKTFISMKGPNFGIEAPGAVKQDMPNIVSNSSPQETEAQQSIFDKILEYIGPAIGAIGALGGAIAALFTGPGVMGDAFKALAKISGQGLKKLLADMSAKVGSRLLKVARYIPFIGAGVSLFFAYKRFKSGDLIGGGMEVLSALLEFIPGAGFILSSAMDVLILARDLTMTDEQKLEQNNSSKIVGVLKKMGSWVTEKLGKNARYLPVIGSFINIGEAITKIKAGDMKGGISSLIQSLMPFIPGFGDSMMKSWDFITSLFKSTDKGDDIKASVPSNILDTIKKSIQSKMSNLPWFIRKPLEWMGILDKTEDSSINFAAPDFTGMYDTSKNILTKFKDTNIKAIEHLTSSASSAFKWVSDNSAGIWEKFKTTNTKAIEEIVRLSSSGLSWIKENTKPAMERFKEVNLKAIQDISDITSSAFKWIKDSAPDMWKQFKDVNSAAMSNVVDYMKGGWENNSEAINRASKTLSDIAPSISADIISVHTLAFSSVKEAASELIEKIKSIELPQLGASDEKNIIVKSDESVAQLKVLVSIEMDQNRILSNILQSINKLNLSPAAAPPLPVYNKSSAATGVFYREDPSILTTD